MSGDPWNWTETFSRTDRPRQEEVTVLCAGCVGFEHCDGREGGCDCTCGLAPDWADIGPALPD